MIDIVSFAFGVCATVTTLAGLSIIQATIRHRRNMKRLSGKYNRLIESVRNDLKCMDREKLTWAISAMEAINKANPGEDGGMLEYAKREYAKRFGSEAQQ